MTQFQDNLIRCKNLCKIMYLLPIILACQDSFRSPSGAQYHDIPEYVHDEAIYSDDFEHHVQANDQDACAYYLAHTL